MLCRGDPFQSGAVNSSQELTPPQFALTKLPPYIERATENGRWVWRPMMRRIISATTLILAIGGSPVCSAEWIKTDSNHESTHYSDSSTKVRDGTKVKIWEMFDLFQPNVYDGVRFRSVKVHVEYDCVSRTMRKNYYVLHAEPEGRGVAVNSFYSNETGWRPIPPDSIGSASFQLACTRP